jgi:HK97 family phage major capsid protein
MENNVTELREKRAELWEECKALHTLAEKENRDLTELEQETWDANSTSMDSLAARIDRMEKVSGIDKGMTARVGDPPNVSTKLGATSRRGAAIEAAGWEQRSTAKPADWDNFSDFGFAGLPEFLSAVRNARRGKFDKRLEQAEVRANSTLSGAGGGYLVPPRMMEEILHSTDELAPWLAKRTIYRISGERKVTVPVLDDADRSTAGGTIAGMSLNRTAEGSTIATDTVAFVGNELNLTGAKSLVKVSNELMGASAVGMGQVLRTLFARAVAAQMAEDFVNGAGGQGGPLGVLNGGDYVQTDETATGATLTVLDLANMLAHLDPGGGDSACFILHPNVVPYIATAIHTGDTSPLWLSATGDGMRQGLVPSLFGLPVWRNPACQTMGTEGDILACNMNAYQYFMSPLRVDVSEHFAFDEDSATFRFVLDDAGQPQRSGTSTDARSWETANFVGLATRA